MPEIRSEKMANTEASVGTSIGNAMSDEDIRKLYGKIATERVLRGKGGSNGVSADMLRELTATVFNVTGEKELLLAGIAKVAQEKWGVKVYNRLRSIVAAKDSGYEIFKNAEGHVMIRISP